MCYNIFTKIKVIKIFKTAVKGVGGIGNMQCRVFLVSKQIGQIDLEKGKPLGRELWVKQQVGRYGLGYTLRKPGRPKGK